MACCLTAPSHYLNQCWLISEVMWRSCEDNFTRDKSLTKISLKITSLKFFPNLPGPNELKWHPFIHDICFSTNKEATKFCHFFYSRQHYLHNLSLSSNTWFCAAHRSNILGLVLLFLLHALKVEEKSQTYNINLVMCQIFRFYLDNTMHLLLSSSTACFLVYDYQGLSQWENMLQM